MISASVMMAAVSFPPSIARARRVSDSASGASMRT